MTRALSFDFSSDAGVVDLKDEFMFGPSFLVAPVTNPMYFTTNSTPLENADKSRRVYLPLGADWIDFWTGTALKGGNGLKLTLLLIKSLCL